MSLIDPTYATDHQPLIASVAEHAPSVWTNYFVTIHHIILFVPLGMYLILSHKNKLSHGNLFIALYTVCSAYFSCAMIRLHLILAPAVCVVAAIAVGWLIRHSTKSIRLSIIGKSII
jgi:dolichyl-diphosphooligosaccharide--protein glycosyltransferase